MNWYNLLLFWFLSTTLSKQTIPQDLYDDLVAYAHLMDIAYCISPITKIEPPFNCDNECSTFPSMQIVQQWSSSDFELFKSPRFFTTGYIAIDHDMEVIVIGLRGTRSFKDTIIDINSDMISLYGVCTGCKVHKGFYSSYQHTWKKIEETVKSLSTNYPNYKVIVSGHSLGGAVGLLISIEILQFHENLHCITMGQPMFGNVYFAKYVNNIFALDETKFTHNAKLIRVTHKNDPVVKLPLSDGFYITDKYTHCSNEIFINEEQNYGNLPAIDNLWYCDGSYDSDCSYGMIFTRDNSEHLNYFRTMGKCGINAWKPFKWPFG